MVGTSAARIAAGMGAQVIVAEANPKRLAYAQNLLRGVAKVVDSSRLETAEVIRKTDLLIGAVYQAGARAPQVISRSHLGLMPKGAVAIDVSIDQGGCLESSRPTTHEIPIYVEDGIIRYCVPNIPSLVSRTATIALSRAIEPFLMLMARTGVEAALERDPSLMRGLNLLKGDIIHKGVLDSLGPLIEKSETWGHDSRDHP